MLFLKFLVNVSFFLYKYFKVNIIQMTFLIIFINRKTASYWNTSLEDVTRIVKGCIQVGLFNGGLYRKYRVLTSEDIQQNYLKTCCMLSQLPNISEELELAVS